MKRFIRTKDDLYDTENLMYRTIKDNKVYQVGWDVEKPTFEADIIAEADTIEELCDGFYLDDKLLNKFNKYAVFEKDELPKVKELFICYTKGKIPFVVYGFIKTSKGLIYVAKMNDEGELELI